MRKQISSQTTDKIVNATEKVCEYVRDGMGVDEAGIKVARDYSLTPGHINLVGRCYNIGVVNSDREDGQSFFQKFAVTSRMRPDKVIESVFPKTAKAAEDLSSVVAPVYRQRERSLDLAIKTAATRKTVKQLPAKTMCDCGKAADSCGCSSKTAYSRAKDLANKIGELKRDLNVAERTAAVKSAAVIDSYRSKYANDNSKLGELRLLAARQFGDVGGMLVDKIAAHQLTKFQFEKYAETCRGLTLGKQTIPMTGDPVLESIKAAVESIRHWALKETEMPKKAFDLRVQIDRLVNPKQSTCLLPPGVSREEFDAKNWEKRSTALSGMLGGLAATMRGQNASPSVESNAVIDAKVKLNDPQHRSELRRLQAETMINSLINNDEVIASYSPDQIADAFDELSQSAPGLVDNPSLMRANLRRLLQGNLTPFDANDMVVQSQRAAAPPLDPSVDSLMKTRSPSPSGAML